MCPKRKRDAIEKPKLKHPCTFAACTYSCRNPGELRDHIDFIHLHNYKNTCDQYHKNGFKCDFKCEKSAELKQHMKNIHMGETNFTCKGCSKVFSREDSCRQHWVAVCSPLDHPGRTRFKCPVCSKGFSTIYDRFDHWVSNCSPENHPSRTTFKCSVCSEGFPTTANRDDHEISCKTVCECVCK